MTPSPQLAAPGVTVGIDVGTTSVKGVAVDPNGAVVGRVRIPHHLTVPTARRLEHDAAAAWWEGPRRAWSALRVHRPVAVAVTAMVPSLAAVNRDGRPVSPGLLYGDERGGGGVSEPLVSGETAALLGWLQEHYPDAVGYWPAQAVANRALGGPGTLDFATACSTGTLFEGGTWPAELKDQVPGVAFFGESIGTLDDGATLVAGGVDAMCEQLVSGAHAGDVLVVCGATQVVWALDAATSAAAGSGAPLPPGVWSLPSATGDVMTTGGPTGAGGLWLDWVERAIRPADPASVTDPESVPVWSPHLRGSRAPDYDPERRAGLAGADITHGPEALRRAAYEAAAFEARRVLEAAGRSGRRIVATGGGTVVAGWMQALADVTALEVHPVGVPEGGALGAAWLARMGAGVETDLAAASRWATSAPSYAPRPEWRDAVEARYQRYCALGG